MKEHVNVGYVTESHWMIRSLMRWNARH